MKDSRKIRSYKQVLQFCTKDLRSIDEKAIRPSSISNTLTMLPAMNNHGDTGDNTTWVAVAGAEHREAEGHPRMEVDHDLGLANQRQQPRREWPPLGLKSQRPERRRG
jgi:hypothetical protein